MTPVQDILGGAGDARAWLTIALDVALKGVLILGVAVATATALRRASAAARHLVWALAVVGLLALPLISAIVPVWRLDILPGLARTPVVSGPDRPDFARGLVDATHPTIDRAGYMATIPVEARRSGSAWPPRPRGAAWLLLGWGAGALVAASRLFLGLAFAWRRVRRATPAGDGPWTGWVEAVASRHGLRRRVDVRLVAGGTMPATWGLWRPVVILPVDAATWPPERLGAVLLHELAHVVRWDFLTQLLGRAACTLHWFNPLAWLAFVRLRDECERASDGLVLEAGLKASDYATQLIQVLKSVRRGRPCPAGAVAMARAGGLERRLHAILKVEATGRRLSRHRAAGMALVALGLILPLGFVRMEARAHDVPMLERLPRGMTIEVVAVSTHPSGPRTWWRPDGTPMAEEPCDPTAEAIKPPGPAKREVVARIVGLPKGATLRWHPNESTSRATDPPQKGGKPVPDLQRVVAEFAEGLATCAVHFDLADGPWTTDQAHDRGGIGVERDGKAYFFSKARETRGGTAIAVAHNLTDREVRIMAVDRDGGERNPTSSSWGGAGHMMMIDAEFDLPPSQIREYQLQSRPMGRFEIKGVALRPIKAGS